MPTVKYLFFFILTSVCFTFGRVSAQQLFKDTMYPLADSPSSLAIGDFNHDGRIDLVVGSSSENSVAVLLANPAGGYNSPALVTSCNAYFVAVSDTNNDGHLDIIGVRLTTHPITTALGDGTGQFPTSVISSELFSNPNSLDVGDLDGDGIVDVVLTFMQQNVLGICSGNGSGGFVLSQATAAGGYPADTTIGDVNNDGITDLVVANRYAGIKTFSHPTTGDIPYIAGTTVSVLYGTSNGVLTMPAPFTVANGPSIVVLRDINNDSYLDILTANDYLGFTSTFDSKTQKYTISQSANSKVSIVLNNGAGVFPAFQAIVCPDIPRRIATTSLNSDGTADLLMTSLNFPNSATLFRSFGDGSGNFSSLSPILNINCREIIGADADGDGNFDIIISDGNSSAVGVLYNNPSGTTNIENHIFSIGNAPERFAVGDVNSDGYPDVVTANSSTVSPNVRILLGSASGAFSAAPPIVINQTPTTQIPLCDVALSDVNNDGKLDVLVAAKAGGAVFIYYGIGDGTFTLGQSFTIVSTSGGHMNAIAAGDLTGDGRPDLVLGSSDIIIYTNDGTGLLNYSSTLPATISPNVIKIADLNGDLQPDILTTAVAIYFGTGGGAFSAPFVFPPSPMSNASSVAIEDINNDDVPDFVATASSGVLFDSIYVGIGNGSGQFTISPAYTGKHMPFIFSGDINRDGAADVVFGETFNSVHVRYGAGTGNFSVGFDLLVKQTIFGATRDFDIDGKLDAAFIVGSGGDSPGVNWFTFLRNVQPTSQNTNYYGSGTAGCRGMMGISANGTPNIGNGSFAICGTNAPARSLGAGLIGDVQLINGTDIFGYQFNVLVDPYNSVEFAGYDILSTDAGTTFTPFPIPNESALQGLQFYIQQIFVESAANGETCSPSAFELVSSRGLSVLIY